MKKITKIFFYAFFAMFSLMANATNIITKEDQKLFFDGIEGKSKNELYALKKLIERGKTPKINNSKINPNLRQGIPRTYLKFLILAIEQGKNEVIRPLMYLIGIKKGVMTNLGAMLLDYATFRKNITAIRKLVQHGCNINSINKKHIPLLTAIKQNDLNTINILINLGANPKNNNILYLHAAARFDKTGKIIQTLVKNGLKLNGKDKEGNTPLHIATLAKNIIAIKTLRKLGAFINPINDQKKTPLLIGVELDDESVIHALIDVGAKINGTNDSEQTPYYKAVVTGKINAVRAFQKYKGAKLNTENHEKILHVAAKCENTKSITQLIKMLIDQGNNINVPNIKNETPLHTAIKNNNLLAVKTLTKYQGININAKNILQNTPLCMAVEMKNIAIIDELIKNEANPNEQVDLMGKTALHKAILYENDIIIGKLLNGGANKKIADIYGETPLDLAKKSQNIKIRQAFGIK